MNEWLKHRQQHNRQRAEIDALSEHELNDIDLSRSELMVVATAPAEVIARQTAMARRFGLDAGDFNENRHDMVAAVEACLRCGATRQCKTHLSGSAGPAAAMAFCPNGDLYADLAAKDKG